MTEQKRIHQIIEYLHTNPVNRGLVPQPEDWKWSSARIRLRGIDEPMAMDRKIPTFAETTE